MTEYGNYSLTMTKNRKKRVSAILSSTNIYAQLTILFFIITFVLKAFTDGIFVTLGMKGAITDTKYLTMGGVIFFGACYMVNTKESASFWEETKQLLSVFFCFLTVTCILIIYRNEFALWQIRDFLNLLTPILFAYVSLNVMNISQIISAMKITLIVSFVGYVIQLIIRGVTWDDIWQSNYGDSTSVLESNDFAALSIVLCFFFCYFRSSKLYTILSLIFALATFKRMAIIFAIIAFLIPMFCNVNRRIKDSSSLIIKVVASIIAIAYLYILLTSSSNIVIFGQKLDDLTMGRADFLHELLANGYQSYGYGSVEATRGASLEMYFVRLMLELSPLAIILFINNYWNITHNNLYCAIMMVFHFLNLTTADSISAMFGWSVAYITFGLINTKSLNNDNPSTSLKYLGSKYCDIQEF